jgi:hypothetical protein
MRKAILAVSVMALTCASAQAVTLGNGISVADSGRVDPAAAPNFAQPLSVLTTGAAPVQIGQPSDPGNPSALGNPGWDPFGQGPGYSPADHTHHWWNVESGRVTFNTWGTQFRMVWGSPNDIGSTSSYNNVSFYTGWNGGGSLIGTVVSYDLYQNFAGINNTQDPGYLITMAMPKAFASVVAGTIPSDFEFAVSGVPEASTWAMMLAGLGFLGFRKSRQDIAVTL